MFLSTTVAGSTKLGIEIAFAFVPPDDAVSFCGRVAPGESASAVPFCTALRAPGDCAAQHAANEPNAAEGAGRDKEFALTAAPLPTIPDWMAAIMMRRCPYQGSSDGNAPQGPTAG